MTLMQQPDLNRIREELKQIALLIGPGSGYNMLLESESDPVLLPLRLEDALTLVPASLLQEVPSPNAAHQVIPVYVRNLFTQIEAGQVLVTLEQLVENFPAGVVGKAGGAMAAELIEIPAGLISDALMADAIAGSM